MNFSFLNLQTSSCFSRTLKDLRTCKDLKISYAISFAFEPHEDPAFLMNRLSQVERKRAEAQRSRQEAASRRLHRSSEWNLWVHFVEKSFDIAIFFGDVLKNHLFTYKQACFQKRSSWIG